MVILITNLLYGQFVIHVHIFLSKSKTRVKLLLTNLRLECYEKINQIQNFI